MVCAVPPAGEFEHCDLEQEGGMTEGLESPRQIGERYGVVKGTVLQWYHQGVIPAAVVVGRVYRFDPAAVEKALRAHTRGEERKRQERMPCDVALIV